MLDQLLNISTAVNIDIQSVIFANLIAFSLGLVIAFFYRYTNKGISYDNSFGFTLVLITVIISSIMLTIRTNLALSLGLIGSLSIIRFRTAVKSSIDMAFLFWTIAAGLAVGASHYPVAVGTTLFLSAIAYILTKLNLFFKTNKDYIMILKLSHLKENEKIDEILMGHLKYHQMKSSFYNKEESEVTYSLSPRNNEALDKMSAELKKLTSVKQISFLSPETNIFI